MTYYEKNRKEKLTYAKNYYRLHREEVLEMMGKETWLTPDEAIRYLKRALEIQPC